MTGKRMKVGIVGAGHNGIGHLQARLESGVLEIAETAQQVSPGLKRASRQSIRFTV